MAAKMIPCFFPTKIVKNKRAIKRKWGTNIRSNPNTFSGKYSTKRLSTIKSKRNKRGRRNFLTNPAPSRLLFPY
jgi:hypothetical protein